jgi:superfamily II DNA or RNA helicase
MSSPSNLNSYLRLHSDELADRILASYPPLHGMDDLPSPALSQMLRTPNPAQTLAIMGVAKRWQISRGAHVVAECGAGKTLIALGMMFVHSQGRPFSGIVMAPPHLVEKWARETFLTLSRVRVFMIDDMRNGGDPKQPHGVNEARLRRGEVVREGLHTTLADLRTLAGAN